MYLALCVQRNGMVSARPFDLIAVIAALFYLYSVYYQVMVHTICSSCAPLKSF